MDDQKFRKAEALLYQYYDNLRQVEYLRSRIDLLTADITQTRETMTIEGRYLVANYGDQKTSGSSGIYHSPQDSVLQQAEEYVTDLLCQRLNLMQRVSKLNQNAVFIDYVINNLTKLEKQIVACLYRDRMSYYQTAEVLHYASHSNIGRYRRRIINKFITLQDQEGTQTVPQVGS